MMLIFDSFAPRKPGAVSIGRMLYKEPIPFWSFIYLCHDVFVLQVNVCFCYDRFSFLVVWWYHVK